MPPREGLAHIPRKFFDVHAASRSPVAAEALRRITQLYAIEQQGAGLDPPRSLALRQQLPFANSTQH
jgi:transposase